MSGWVKIEQDARAKAADYMERASRCADKGSAVGTREWLDAAAVATAIAERAKRIREGAR